MASGTQERPYDSIHTCNKDQKVFTVAKAGGTFTIPWSDTLVISGHAYLLTVVGDNNTWRFAGILFFGTPTNRILPLTTDTTYVNVTVDTNGITITNNHPDYGMNMSLELIGSMI